MITSKAIVKKGSWILLILCLSSCVLADQIDNPGGVVSSFASDINPIVNHIISNDSDYKRCAKLIFSFFLFIRTVFFISRYVLDGVSKHEVIEYVVFAAVSWSMVSHLSMYADTVTTLFDAANGAIQKAFVGNDDMFFVPQYIESVTDSITYEDKGFFDSANTFIATIILSLMTTILGIVSYLSLIWSLWGISVTKIIALLMAPTMIFQPLSFLFDGTLRLFIGFHAYTFIMRICMLMTVYLLQATFDLPGGIQAGPYAGDGIYLNVENGMGDKGLTGVLIISIIMALTSYKFANTITGGAQMSLGGSIRTLVKKI